MRSPTRVTLLVRVGVAGGGSGGRVEDEDGADGAAAVGANAVVVGGVPLLRIAVSPQRMRTRLMAEAAMTRRRPVGSCRLPTGLERTDANPPSPTGASSVAATAGAVRSAARGSSASMSAARRLADGRRRG